MNSYFITQKGVDLIGLELSELAENHGLDHLADWCPNAVANEIVGTADFDLDMQRNGHFVHELGIRSPRGHILTMTIDRSHCEALSFARETDCECGLDDKGTWKEAVFDRYGCDCPIVEGGAS